MKAVLVIDMPKDCGDCPCIHDELWKCQADKQFREGTYYNGRPSWCPLRPLPKKMKRRATDEATDLIYSTGWNDCLAEMMGETE